MDIDFIKYIKSRGMHTTSVSLHSISRKIVEIVEEDCGDCVSTVFYKLALTYLRDVSYKLALHTSGTRK